MVPVIVITHNNASTIEQSIKALLDTDFDIDVYILDNASQDNTINILEQFRDSIHIIKMNKNLGFSGGVNYALKFVPKTNYFALLNPDAFPTKSWLKELYEALEANPKIGMGQSLLLSQHGGIDSAGGMLNFWGYPIEIKAVLSNEPYEVQYAKGAAVLIRRVAYDMAGGFDDRLFFYYDEADLCAKMRRIGYRCYVVPKSVVYHIGLGSAIPNKELFVLYYMERNRLLYIHENERWKLPLALMYGIAGALKDRGIRRGVRLRALRDYVKLVLGKAVEEPFVCC